MEVLYRGKVENHQENNGVVKLSGDFAIVSDGKQALAILSDHGNNAKPSGIDLKEIGLTSQTAFKSGAVFTKEALELRVGNKALVKAANDVSSAALKALSTPTAP